MGVQFVFDRNKHIRFTVNIILLSDFQFLENDITFCLRLEKLQPLQTKKSVNLQNNNVTTMMLNRITFLKQVACLFSYNVILHNAKSSYVFPNLTTPYVQLFSVPHPLYLQEPTSDR